MFFFFCLFVLNLLLICWCMFVAVLETCCFERLLGKYVDVIKRGFNTYKHLDEALYLEILRENPSD